jgi:transposase-like protein
MDSRIEGDIVQKYCKGCKASRLMVYVGDWNLTKEEMNNPSFQRYIGAKEFKCTLCNSSFVYLRGENNE